MVILSAAAMGLMRKELIDTLGHDAAEHRFEIVDVAVGRPLEFEVGFIVGGKRLHFASVEQPHRATGEHAAVALELGFPRLVVDLVGQDLADVDGG